MREKPQQRGHGLELDSVYSDPRHNTEVDDFIARRKREEEEAKQSLEQPHIKRPKVVADLKQRVAALNERKAAQEPKKPPLSLEAQIEIESMGIELPDTEETFSATEAINIPDAYAKETESISDDERTMTTTYLNRALDFFDEEEIQIYLDDNLYSGFFSELDGDLYISSQAASTLMELKEGIFGKNKDQAKPLF